MALLTSTSPRFRVRPLGSAALLGACLSCARVLGIPGDPELVDSDLSQSAPTSDDGNGPLPSLDPPPADVAPNAEPGNARSDGVLPPGSVGGIDSTLETGGTGSDPQLPLEPGEPAARDAGAFDGGAGADPGPRCDPSERVPVDVVFMVDNSGSMLEETQAFEQALPSFVEQLDDDAVDHRVILLSRQRRDERSASEEASTSVCVAAPVSGLAACPSERPALGSRFFHYSVKLDDDDSLTRALEAFSEPDPFGLTASGWSEWLRPGARTVFVELTDADSSLGANAFVAALQALAPEVFGSDPARPDFVFHAVTGVIEKAFAADIYFADEPIETAVCSGTGSNPDNAGVVYQELSRLTGGVRLSICPAAPLTLRLAALAVDVSRRSVRQCTNADR